VEITYNLQTIASFESCPQTRFLRPTAKIKAAIEDYQQAIKLKPDYAEAHYNLADVFEDIPDYEKAFVSTSVLLMLILHSIQHTTIYHAFIFCT
jgi:tetratricopeptide (TPR) repeat protein